MSARLYATRLSLGLFLTLPCVGCTSVKHATLQPQADQVVFFDRPQTLAAARKSELPRPVIVLLENNPWAMVIGAESPAFALYDDGTAIWRNGDGFKTSRLTKLEQKRFLDGLSLDAMLALYGHYDADQSTDQPKQDLLIYQGSKPIFISVYGSLRDTQVRIRIPAEIVAAYDRITAFNRAPNKDWLPENIEVMVWPYEYAPSTSIKWPESWPDLNDPRTIQRGDSFSIFIPSSELGEVRAFLSKKHKKGAVEIGGRKWAVSVRYPFPHERLWRAPHPELDEAKR